MSCPKRWNYWHRAVGPINIYSFTFKSFYSTQNQGGHRKLCLSLPLTHLRGYATTKQKQSIHFWVKGLKLSRFPLFSCSAVRRWSGVLFKTHLLCPWEMEAAVSLGCGKSGPPFSIAKQSLLCYRGKGLKFSRYSVIDAVGLSVGSSPLFDRVSMCESLVRERLCGNAKAYRPSSSFVG